MADGTPCERDVWGIVTPLIGSVRRGSGASLADGRHLSPIGNPPTCKLAHARARW
jgi:hypothetical protein